MSTSRGLVTFFRPFVCRQCQARSLASKQLFSHRTRTSHSSDNPEAVERRISALGGRETIGKFFEDVQNRYEGPLVPAALLGSHAEGRKPTTPNSQNVESVTVYGRVTSKRNFSRNLAFFSIGTGGEITGDAPLAQVVLSKSVLHKDQGMESNTITEFFKTVQRGDWIIARGNIVQTKDGGWAVKATEMPRMLAPSLQTVPHTIADEEFRMRNRHAEQIVRPSAKDILFLRHRLLSGLRGFLNERKFIEVTTPLLQPNAGGAIARPFETVATEFSRLKLNLRVAPELYLKRLIIGGMQRVYELGLAFRNEGVDATHNPEFTTCEFYGVMMRLQDLMLLTEQMFRYLAEIAQKAHLDMPDTVPLVDPHLFKGPFQTISFIPGIREGIKQRLPDWTVPDLDSHDALQNLTETLEMLNMSIPEKPTVPRLLDALAAEFIEPKCTKPTFITHHPACMGPLAKSFYEESAVEGEVRHRVSARAELFIQGREYVNCYEEENSPIEQRRKFEEQLYHRHPSDTLETHSEVDESYLSALEWGMPPTGGWGCGVDRIVMLFSGQSRIADVLPFGTLRNVVGRAKATKERSDS